MRSHQLLAVCGAEALGTFILVLIGPGAAIVASETGAFGHSGIALAFGVAVAIAVAATGPISGAHINPSVTIALWSASRFPSRHVPPYIAAQLTGAVAASLVSHWAAGAQVAADATVPAVSLLRAFVIEAGYSGLLAFVIARVVDTRLPSEVPGAPLIGATVFAGALITGPFTGGSFNPARTFGPALVTGTWTAHWLYWVAPTMGMVLGMQLYSLLARRALTFVRDPSQTVR
jgi:aquaporin Z